MTHHTVHCISLVLSDRIRRLQDAYARARDMNLPARAEELRLSYHGAIRMAIRHSREIRCA